jgi:hypothetical protein
VYTHKRSARQIAAEAAGGAAKSGPKHEHGTGSPATDRQTANPMKPDNVAAEHQSEPPRLTGSMRPNVSTTSHATRIRAAGMARYGGISIDPSRVATSWGSAIAFARAARPSVAATTKTEYREKERWSRSNRLPSMVYLENPRPT